MTEAAQPLPTQHPTLQLIDELATAETSYQLLDRLKDLHLPIIGLVVDKDVAVMEQAFGKLEAFTDAYIKRQGELIESDLLADVTLTLAGIYTHQLDGALGLILPPEVDMLDDIRRKLLRRLNPKGDFGYTAAELALMVGESQPRVSGHLEWLHSNQLASQRRGVTIRYWRTQHGDEVVAHLGES